MVRDELSVLSAFLAVAEERSFTRAAKQLGVAPTEAGAQFLARIRPALADVRGALDQVTGLREQPAGRVRLVASRLAARMVLAPKLAKFARASSVRGVLSLLPESPAATRCAVGTHRSAAAEATGQEEQLSRVRASVPRRSRVILRPSAQAAALTGQAP